MLRIVPHGSEMCMAREVRKTTPKGLTERVTEGRVVVVTIHKALALGDTCYALPSTWGSRRKEIL